MECMRRECETAKKMAKETQEKYLSESSKLRTIIREQKGKITDHNFRPRMRSDWVLLSTSTILFVILPTSSTFSDWRRTCHVPSVKTL